MTAPRKLKLKLDLDAIRVETFVTGGGDAHSGTVYGLGVSEFGTCGDACHPTNAHVVTCVGGITPPSAGGTCYCESAACTGNTNYNTCRCADESAPGYGSCGTTCDQTCENTGCYQTNGCPPGYTNGCPPDPTTPAAGCWDA